MNPHSTKQLSKILRFVLIISAIFLHLSCATTGFADGSSWMEPKYISDSENNADIFLVSTIDREERIHVFWRETINDGEITRTLIFHRTLEGSEWSEPVDIIAPSDTNIVSFVDVEIDDQNDINLIWVGSQGARKDLFLSKAPGCCSLSSQKWQTQSLYSSQIAVGYATIEAGPGGRLHVAFSADNAVVLYLYSDDYGKTWARPDQVWSVMDPRESAIFGATALAVDDQGNPHITWAVSSSDRNWNPDAIWYSRHLDTNRAWQTDRIIKSTPDEPTNAWSDLIVRNGHEIHLVWSRGVGSWDGRYHTWSPDYGTTWSTPQIIQPDLSGQTFLPGLNLDSSSRIHLVTGAASGVYDGETRPTHLVWDGVSWSQPESLRPYGEHVAAVIRGGNELFVFWQAHLSFVPLVTRIAYSRKTLDTPRMEPASTIVPSVTEADTGSLENQVSSELVIDKSFDDVSRPSTADNPAIEPNANWQDNPRVHVPPAMPLVMAILSSFAVVAIVVFWSVRQKGR